MPRVVGPPQVSIVLVTRNGAETLQSVLDAIDSQDVSFPFEIVAVDSGSTDSTREILQGRVDTLVTIAPEEFNHGATRNLAVEHATGELVVMLVQDAVPRSNNWLAELTAPFASDPRIAGTFCRQVPRADASAITKLYLNRWFAAGEQARRVAIEHGATLDGLDAIERLDRCTFDNVCSCIRRSVWQAHRFARTPIAEDLEWANAVLRAGYAIEYVPQAVVSHSHDRSARYEFARTYTLHRRLFELFGVQTIPTLGALVRAVVGAAHLHVACVRRASPPEPMRSLGRALALAVAWPTGQYLGALSAAKRWTPLRFRGV